MVNSPNRLVPLTVCVDESDACDWRCANLGSQVRNVIESELAAGIKDCKRVELVNAPVSIGLAFCYFKRIDRHLAKARVAVSQM